MKGTYNAHGRQGSIVQDPTWIIEYGDAMYGGFGQLGPLELEWVFYIEEGIPFGDVKKRLAADTPTMVVRADEKVTECHYDYGRWWYREL